MPPFGLLIFNSWYLVQVSELTCPRCGTRFTSRDALLRHLQDSTHVGLDPPLPSTKNTESQTSPRGPWDHDAFLAPYLQDDPLLYTLEDNDIDLEEEAGAVDEGRDEVGGLVSQLPRAMSMDPGYEADVSVHGGLHPPGTSHVTKQTPALRDSPTSSTGSERGMRLDVGSGPGGFDSDAGSVSGQTRSFGEQSQRSPVGGVGDKVAPRAGGLKARVSPPAPLEAGLTRELHEGDRLQMLERENEDLRAELAALKIAQQDTEELQVGRACVGCSGKRAFSTFQKYAYTRGWSTGT